MIDDSQLPKQTANPGSALPVEAGPVDAGWAQQITRDLGVGKASVCRKFTHYINILSFGFAGRGGAFARLGGGKAMIADRSNDRTILVIYMGAVNIAKIASQLIRHGMASSLPVMAASAATPAHVYSDPQAAFGAAPPKGGWPMPDTLSNFSNLTWQVPT